MKQTPSPEPSPGGRGRREIRVLLADDHELVREGLAQILEDTPGIRVAGQAGRAAEAVDLALELRPDLVLLDYSMPDLDAPSTIGRLRERLPDVKVLIVTVHESIHYAVRALECGAHGYVVKSAAVQELVDAVRTVDEGEVFISPKISQKILENLRNPKRGDRVGIAALSPREFELLRMLGSGMGLKECARRLDVTTSTASTYRARLMEKLHLTTTAEIIRFAIEQDIVR